MITIDRAYLGELGLGALPDDVAAEFLAHVVDTLEIRTGTVLAEKMGPAAIEQFMAIDESDEEARRSFLEAHVPDYLEIGEAQFAELTEEIRSVGPRILELEGLESAS